ncbi:hypothetical protein WAE61_06105 [Comamonadaceae bacterium PP-2]
MRQLIRRNANIIGLASGSIMGQGAYFCASAFIVAQGWLVQQAQLSLIFSLTTLFLWFVDFSTSTILARMLNSSEFTKIMLIISAVRIRLTAWCLLVIFLVVSAYISEIENKWHFFWLATLQGLLWIFNLSGYFDGTKRNAIAGPVASINWFLVSWYLLLQSHIGSEQVLFAYYIFSFGSIVTVVIHWVIFFFMEKNLHVSREIYFVISFRDAFALSIGSMSAQAYPRAILSFVYYALSPALAGIISFVKTALNGVNLIVSIIRRHDLIELTKSSDWRIGSIFKIQRNSLAVGFLGYIFSLMLVMMVGYSRFEGYAHLVVLFHVASVLWLVSSALYQKLIASGLYSQYSKGILLSVLINLGCAFLLSLLIGVWAIPFAEIFMCIFQYLYYKAIQNEH